MKRTCKRLTAGLLALMLLSSTCLASTASTLPSRHFARTEVWCTAMGNGILTVEYDINATETMDELGVLYVTFYQQQSNGSWAQVMTYDWNNISGLTESNAYTKEGRLWYQGVAGAKYYAEVGCYAKLGSRDATLAQNTRVITAT